jgi:DNA-binding NarL/FixJ family response regulator
VKVVILTMHENPAYARRAFQLGASGFVLKHSAAIELTAAIRAVVRGKTYTTRDIADSVPRGVEHEPRKPGDELYALTPRQREILQLLAQGRSAKDIARDLAISARTVEFHKYQIMQIHGLHSSAELVHLAIKCGIVTI